MKTPEQIIIEQKWPDDVPFETMYYKTTEIIIKCMKQYAAQFKQAGINTNVVRPASASASDGELLPAEVLALTVCVDLVDHEYEPIGNQMWRCQKCGHEIRG